MEKITVRELLEREVDVDVDDDYAGEIGIAFVGPAKLTKAGQNYFNSVLDLPVELDDCYATIGINDCENPDMMLDVANSLFWSLAGYCSDKLYNTWFE